MEIKYKWFGNKVCNVSEAVVLTSGRETPSENEGLQRVEGVALVLLGWAVEAWKASGGTWTV